MLLILLESRMYMEAWILKEIKNWWIYFIIHKFVVTTFHGFLLNKTILIALSVWSRKVFHKLIQSEVHECLQSVASK